MLDLKGVGHVASPRRLHNVRTAYITNGAPAGLKEESEDHPQKRE